MSVKISKSHKNRAFMEEVVSSIVSGNQKAFSGLLTKCIDLSQYKPKAREQDPVLDLLIEISKVSFKSSLLNPDRASMIAESLAKHESLSGNAKLMSLVMLAGSLKKDELQHFFGKNGTLVAKEGELSILSDRIVSSSHYHRQEEPDLDVSIVMFNNFRSFGQYAAFGQVQHHYMSNEDRMFFVKQLPIPDQKFFFEHIRNALNSENLNYVVDLGVYPQMSRDIVSALDQTFKCGDKERFSKILENISLDSKSGTFLDFGAYKTILSIKPDRETPEHSEMREMISKAHKEECFSRIAKFEKEPLPRGFNAFSKVIHQALKNSDRGLFEAAVGVLEDDLIPQFSQHIVNFYASVTNSYQHNRDFFRFGSQEKITEDQIAMLAQLKGLSEKSLQVMFEDSLKDPEPRKELPMTALRRDFDMLLGM